MVRNRMLVWAVLCVVALASDNAAIVPQQAVQPQLAAGDVADAITIPKLLSYQGKLTDTLGMPVPDTTYQVQFRLYTVPTGGSPFWNETQTVRTKGGLFSVLLGAVNAIDSVPQAGSLYLGMAVAGGPELAPRLRLVSVAYSYCSDNAARLDGNNLSALDSRFVNEGQSNSVTSGMIQDGAVQTADIANTAVTSAKIGNGEVTMPKINQSGAAIGQVIKWNGSQWAPADDSAGGPPTGPAGGDLTGTYPNPTIATSAVNSAKIADGTIVAADLNQMGATSGQVLKWTGSAWEPRNDSIGQGDNAWVRGTPDSVLYTIRQLGMARGGSGNMLYGDYRYNHTNLGVACTTGASGQNYGYCTVGGGFRNTASGERATVGGGFCNTAGGNYTTVAGGLNNAASGQAATVGGGYGDSATGMSSTVSGGANNRATANYAAVCGGQSNLASGSHSTIGGGYENTASGIDATVGGGLRNYAADYATVGGGVNDSALGVRSTVAGGTSNKAVGDYSTIGGGFNNRALGRGSFIGGGYLDTVNGVYCGVGCGYGNVAGDASTDTASTVAGGRWNKAIAMHSFVGGGSHNTASSGNATVGGGGGNTASGPYATVAGGNENTASGWEATVGGGWNNYATASRATIGGGNDNTASGGNATIPGGYSNTAAGYGSFAANTFSYVGSTHNSSAAFNGTTTTASNQLRCYSLQQGYGGFTIDHPLDPYGKILNHYFIEGPEMLNIYRGSVVLDATGRAEVKLPDYFSALNRNPHIQLTGVGTYEIYVVEDVKDNRFVIGGPANAKVYWLVTGERQDITAEIGRRLVPVEQPKTGELAGRMFDDEGLAGCMEQLVREGKAEGLDFRTAAGRARYERMKNPPSPEMER